FDGESLGWFLPIGLCHFLRRNTVLVRIVHRAIVFHLVSLDLCSSFTDSEKSGAYSGSKTFLANFLIIIKIPQDNVLFPKIWNKTKFIT
ncbi:unnamed protein product, partial [Brassica oleracea]